MKHHVWDAVGERWFGSGGVPLAFPTARHAEVCAAYLTRKYGRAFFPRTLET